MQPPSFDILEEGEKFSSVFLAKTRSDSPEENFASLNAGDYDCYVGGGTINGQFEKDLREAGPSCWMGKRSWLELDQHQW